MENRTKRETGLSAESLDDILMEFDQVVQDFDQGAPSQYEDHLAELKRQALPGTYDSGIDGSESSSASPGSSLNTSEEDLNTPNTLTTTSSHSKAKLGDTHELEAFIADLDKVLEEM